MSSVPNGYRLGLSEQEELGAQGRRVTLSAGLSAHNAVRQLAATGLKTSLVAVVIVTGCHP